MGLTMTGWLLLDLFLLGIEGIAKHL